MNVANKAIIRKLALSKLKINRRRTIWTILGIVLSTAIMRYSASKLRGGNIVEAIRLESGS
jgi:hypothetical protein